MLTPDSHFRIPAMRTNIEIDDKLIKEMMRLNPNLKTKKDAVNHAMREYVSYHRGRSLLDLAGKGLLDPNYDYKKARAAG